MPCVFCGDYWVCDPDDTPDCDDVPHAQAMSRAPQWQDKGTQELSAGTYSLWCKPGCDATIATSSPGGGWIELGEKHFAAGTYRRWCKTGGAGGDKCKAAVKKE